MPSTVRVKCACGCGATFTARVADRKRGWARFATKSCKARHQERRTGQHAAFLDRSRREGFYDSNGEYVGFSGHNFSNEEHDCNKD
jgi:hypothetical protein